MKNPALLTGILRCAPCDAAMTPTYSQRGIRRYRYYLCLLAHCKGRATCPSKSIPSIDVEKFVVDQVLRETFEERSEESPWFSTGTRRTMTRRTKKTL